MTTGAEPLRVLFLCTGNSARSQMAEALLRERGGSRFAVASAGSHPAERVHPLAVSTLAAAGIDWAGKLPRGLTDLDGNAWDIVITVCDHAQEACPWLPNQRIRVHWGMADPAAVEGTEDVCQLAFIDAFATLSRRVDRLVALPIASGDQAMLQAWLQEIGDEGP
ncbi:MAG TPA: arsenate reductase ArsC [Gemmatimonadales bacterium]|jgi:arsenate reductase